MRPKRYLEDTQTQAPREQDQGTSTAEPAEESSDANRPAGPDAPSNDAAYLGDLLQKIYKREFFSDVPPQFAWLRLSDESLDDAFQRVQLAYDTGGARAAFEEARKASVANWRDGRLGKGVPEALPKGCDTAEYEKEKRVAKEVYDKQLKKLHEAMLYALRRALVQPKPKWMQVRAKSPAAKMPKASKGVCGWWEEPNPQQPKDDEAATKAKQPVKPVESEAVGTQTQQEEQGTGEGGGVGTSASQQAPAASTMGHAQVQSKGSLAADDDILAHLPRYVPQESIDADRRRTQEGEQGVGVGGGGGAGSRPFTTPTPQPQPPPGYTSPDIMIQHAQPAGGQPRAPVSRTDSIQPPVALLSARRVVSRGESMSMYQRPPVGSMGSGPMHGRVRSIDGLPMGVPSSLQQSSGGSLVAPGTHSRPSTGMASQALMQQQQQQRQSLSGSMLSRAGSVTMATGQPRAPLSRADSMTVGPLSIGGGSGGSARPRSRANSITSVPRTVVTSAGRLPLSRAGSLERSVMSRTSMVPRAPLRQSQVLEPTLLQPQPSAEQMRSRVSSLQHSMSETMRSRVSSAGSVPSGGVPPPDLRSRAGSAPQASVTGGRGSVGGAGGVSLAGMTQQQQPPLQQQQRMLSRFSSTAPAGSISSSEGRSAGPPPNLAMTQPLYTSAQQQPLPLPPPPSTARRPRTSTGISQLSGGSAGSAPQPSWAPPAWEPLPQDIFTHTSPPESIMSHPQRTVHSAGAAGAALSMSSTMRSATSQAPQQRQSMGGVQQSMNAGASVAPPARAKSQSLPPNNMSVTGGAGSVSSSRHSQGPSVSMSQGLRPPWASQTLQSTQRRGVDQPTVRQQPGGPPQPPPAPSLSQQMFETIRSVSPVQDMPLSQAEQSMMHQQQPPQADEQNGSVAPPQRQQHSRQSSLDYSLAPSAAPPPQRQHPSSASVASAARTIDGRMKQSMKSGPSQQLPMAQSVGRDMRDSGRMGGAGGQSRYEDEMDTHSIRSRQPTVRLPPQRIQLSPPPEPDDRSVHTTRQLMQRQDSTGQQSVRSLQPSVMRRTMQPPPPPPPPPPQQPDEQSRAPHGGGMTQQPMQRQGSMGEASIRSHQPSIMRRTMPPPPPPPPQQPDVQSRVAYDDGGIIRQNMQKQDSAGERSIRSHQPSVFRRTAQAQPPPPPVLAEHESQQGYDEVVRQSMQRQGSMGEASVRSHQPSVMRRTAQPPPPPSHALAEYQSQHGFDEGVARQTMQRQASMGAASVRSHQPSVMRRPAQQSAPSSHAPAEYQSQQGFDEVVSRQTMQRQASMGAASVRSHQPSIMRHTVQQPPPPPHAAAEQQSQQGFDQIAALRTMQRQASMGEASIRSHQPSVMRRTAQQPPPPPPPPVQAPAHPDQQSYAGRHATFDREESLAHSVVAPSIGTARITQSLQHKMDDGRRVTTREPTVDGDVGRQTVRREESMDERTLRSHQPSRMRRTAQQSQPPPQQQLDHQQSHEEFIGQQSMRRQQDSMDASVAAPSVRTARHVTMGPDAVDDGVGTHTRGGGVRSQDVYGGVTRQTMQRLESSDETTLRSHQPSVMRRTVQQPPPSQPVTHDAYAEQQSVRGRQDSAGASIAERTLRGATRGLHMTEHGPDVEMLPEVGSMMDARRMETGAAHQSVRRQESMGEQSLRSHQPSVMRRTAQSQPLQQPPPPTQLEPRQQQEYMQEGMARQREESVERSLAAPPLAHPPATQHYEHEPEMSTYKGGTQTLQQVTSAPLEQYALEEEVDERTMRSHQPSVMRRTAASTAEHVLQPEASQSYADQRHAQTYTQQHEGRASQESVHRSFAPPSGTPVAPAGGSDGDGRGHYVQQQDDVEERSMGSRQASVMRGPPSQPHVPPPHASQQMRPEQMEPQEYVEEQSYGMRQGVHAPTTATQMRDHVRAAESLQQSDSHADAMQTHMAAATARVRDGPEVQQPLLPQHDAEAPRPQAAAMSAASRTGERHEEEYVERERALEEQTLKSTQQPSVMRRTQTQAPPPAQQTQRGLHDDQRSQAQPGTLQAPAVRTLDEDYVALPGQRSVQQQQQQQQHKDVSKGTQRLPAHVPHISDGDGEGRPMPSDAYPERGLGMSEEPSMTRRTLQAATASVHLQDQQPQKQQQQHDGQMPAEDQSFFGEDDEVPTKGRGRPVKRPSVGVHDQDMVAADRIVYDTQDQPDAGPGGEGADGKSQPPVHRQQRKADLGALRPQQRQDVRETSTVAPSQRRRPSLSPRQVQPDVEEQSLADLQQGDVEPFNAAEDLRRAVHAPQQQQQQQQQLSSSATVRAPPSLQRQPGLGAAAGSQAAPSTQHDVRHETQSVRPAGVRSVTYEDDDPAVLHSQRPSHAIDQATVAASRRMPPRRLSHDEEPQAYPADRTVSGARTVSGGREAFRRGSIAPSVAPSRRPPQSVAPHTDMEMQGGDEMMPYEQSAADEIPQDEEVYNAPSGGVAQRSGVSVRQLQQPPSGGTVAPMPSTRSVYMRSQPQQQEEQQRAHDGRADSRYDGTDAYVQADDGVDVRGATQPHVRRVLWGGTVSVSDTITASDNESYAEYADADALGGRGTMADDGSRLMQQRTQQQRSPFEDRQQGPMSRATPSIAPTQRRQPQSLQPPPQPKQQQPVATYGGEDQARHAYSIQQQQKYADDTPYVADYGYVNDAAELQAQQSFHARDWQQQQLYAAEGAQNASYPYGEGVPMGGEEYVEAPAQSPLDQYHSFEVEPMDGDVYDGQWMDGVVVVADQGQGYYTDDGRAYMQPQQQQWSGEEPVNEQARGGGPYAAVEGRRSGPPQAQQQQQYHYDQPGHAGRQQSFAISEPTFDGSGYYDDLQQQQTYGPLDGGEGMYMSVEDQQPCYAGGAGAKYHGEDVYGESAETAFDGMYGDGRMGAEGEETMPIGEGGGWRVRLRGHDVDAVQQTQHGRWRLTIRDGEIEMEDMLPQRQQQQQQLQQQKQQQEAYGVGPAAYDAQDEYDDAAPHMYDDTAAPHLYDETAPQYEYLDTAPQFVDSYDTYAIEPIIAPLEGDMYDYVDVPAVEDEVYEDDGSYAGVGVAQSYGGGQQVDMGGQVAVGGHHEGVVRPMHAVQGDDVEKDEQDAVRQELGTIETLLRFVTDGIDVRGEKLGADRQQVPVTLQELESTMASLQVAIDGVVRRFEERAGEG